jgi:hypothetical protein
MEAPGARGPRAGETSLDVPPATATGGHRHPLTAGQACGECRQPLP